MSRHAVFDLDGTLVDSVGVCADILNAMLVDRGSPARISRAETKRYVSLGGPRMVQALLGADCGDADQAISEFRQRYADMPTPDSSVFPGVRSGLAHLARLGIQLSICSAKPQRLCEKVLRDLHLDQHFTAIVGSRPGRPSKPDPDHLDEALRMAGGSRQRSCYIGDSEVDHALATAAGIPLVMVTYGYADAGIDLAGVFLADHFNAVPGIVESLLFKGPGVSELPSGAGGVTVRLRGGGEVARPSAGWAAPSSANAKYNSRPVSNR